MNLMRAMWKACGALLIMGIVLHLAMDFPLALLCFVAWGALSFLPGMSDEERDESRSHSAR